MDDNVVSLGELYDQFTSDEQVREATAFKTVRDGTYRLRGTDFIVRRSPMEPPAYAQAAQSHVPGRVIARLQATLLDREGTRIGTVFFNASWEVHRRPNRQGELTLDGPSRLWGQLVKSLDMGTAPVPHVLKAFVEYSLMGTVVESFKTPEGSLVSARRPTVEATEQAREEYLDAGYVPVNFVMGLSRVK